MLTFNKKRKLQRKAIEEKNRPFPVLIGIPVPNIDFRLSHGLNIFTSLCAGRQLGIDECMPAKCPEFARNKIIAKFLNDDEYKDFTHLLFMDADTYPADHMMLAKLLAHDKDVVAGITPVYTEPKVKFYEVDEGGKKVKKRIEIPAHFNWNIQVEGRGGNLPLNALGRDLFKASKVGGTSILIKRRVLEKLQIPYQRPTLDDAWVNHVQSEDYYFCERITEAGFDIWVDPTQLCHHRHNMDLLEIVQFFSQVVQNNSNAIDLLNRLWGYLEKSEPVPQELLADTKNLLVEVEAVKGEDKV